MPLYFHVWTARLSPCAHSGCSDLVQTCADNRFTFFPITCLQGTCWLKYSSMWEVPVHATEQNRNGTPKLAYRTESAYTLISRLNLHQHRPQRVCISSETRQNYYHKAIHASMHQFVGHERKTTLKRTGQQSNRMSAKPIETNRTEGLLFTQHDGVVYILNLKNVTNGAQPRGFSIKCVHSLKG